MLKSICRLCALCFALLILASYPLAAQRDTATLEGRIVDVTGAVVANASVTATNTSTNFSYHAKSDGEGAWTISPVRIGSYQITISAVGFKQTVTGPITLDVQQRQRVDATLQLGEVTQQVVVNDIAPLLETDSSEPARSSTARPWWAFR